jgi:hypothetical protein
MRTEIQFADLRDAPTDVHRTSGTASGDGGELGFSHFVKSGD